MNDHIQSTINTITCLARQGAEMDDLKAEIRTLLSIAPKSLGSIYEPGVTLYRATKHHTSIPTRIEEIWYPPSERTGWNRTNRPKQPMFYCTSDPDCALREIGADVGNTVVFATWRTRQQMMLHDLGFSSQVMTRAGSRRLLSEHHKKFYLTQLNPDEKTIRDFIALAFTEPSPKDYRLTVAIAETHSDPDFTGLLYPSVAKAANTDNLALLTSFVHEGLQLVKAQVFRVDQKDPDGRVSGAIICELAGVSETGDLSWTYGGASEIVPPGTGSVLRPGRKITAQTTGEISLDRKHYHIKPGYSIQLEDGEPVVRDVQNRIVTPT